ncbi:hypothetical protein Hbl1158_03355 [Halobaculum sp. CBA1158]|uniref:hypothetical protein n=1 Tax=Halobaculum sp. CBA1158 TaxID=2904243 RepID=UPI001F20DDC2|nr:hypothetical protein [Halobaculum sp. CBA1158]UIP00415.1 hypothetical protein Hbl1158_03355 [Halobaculum sp. CBA1158]
MGLFERIGRQVEQFKQTAKAEAERNAEYRCQACGERFEVDRDECPECGAEAVVARTDEEE